MPVLGASGTAPTVAQPVQPAIDCQRPEFYAACFGDAPVIAPEHDPGADTPGTESAFTDLDQNLPLVCVEAGLDSDGDGLSNGDEVLTYRSNPRAMDSDGDCRGDGDELITGTNPLSEDSDGDGTLDRVDREPANAANASLVYEGFDWCDYRLARRLPVWMLPPYGVPMTHDVVNLEDRLAMFTDYWAPRTVATCNGNDIMVVRVLGEFTWHEHSDTDDVFLVLKGRLDIRMRDRTVTLGPGDLFVVPCGIEHQPYAAEETHLLLIEPTGTPNTGDPATAQPRRPV